MVAKLKIKGVEYDQPASTTAKQLGINYSTLMFRVKSDKPAWAEWKYSEVHALIVINDRHYAHIDEAIFALLNLKKREDKGSQNSVENSDFDKAIFALLDLKQQKSKQQKSKNNEN